MEEIQNNLETTEPQVDNSQPVSTAQEGQATQAPSEANLGKFKSVDELSKAYEQLQKLQGQQSQELGELRQNKGAFEVVQKVWQQRQELFDASNELKTVSEKYNTPEYFQNPSFRDIYGEAFKALGKNLDSEKFINMLENYVSSRLYAHEKSGAKKNETESITNAMSFAPEKSTSLKAPTKRLDEMTPKEVDELLERII